MTESITNEDVREQKLKSLRKIRDNYKKIALSIDTRFDTSYDGIRLLNLIDWILNE